MLGLRFKKRENVRGTIGKLVFLKGLRKGVGVGFETRKKNPSFGCHSI